MDNPNPYGSDEPELIYIDDRPGRMPLWQVLLLVASIFVVYCIVYGWPVEQLPEPIFGRQSHQ